MTRKSLSVILMVLCLFALQAASADTLRLPRNLSVIEDEAFYGDTSLDEIVLPEGIREIGARAFAGSSVKKVSLPASLTRIANDAFDWDVELIAPEGTYAFEYTEVHSGSPQDWFEYEENGDGTCTLVRYTGPKKNSQNMIIPKRNLNRSLVTAIGENAFSGFPGLTGTLTFPDTVTAIGAGAFDRCGFTGPLTLPDSIRSIGDGAFQNCSGFDYQLRLPEKLTAIGKNVFRNCSGFTVNLLIPGQVKSIGAGAFEGCNFSGNVTIGGSVTSIGKRAFAGTPLDSGHTELPEGLLKIEAEAFADTGLHDVRLPDSLTYISPDAFRGCDPLRPYVSAGSYAAEWCAKNAPDYYTVSGLGVAYRSVKQIRAFMKTHPAETESETTFRKAPTGPEFDGGDTYSYGLIDEYSLTNGINMVNTIRYIAGINADVVNAEDKEEICAASALVTKLNGSLSHHPDRPEALADSRYDELYTMAQQGSGSSNLHSGLTNLAATVLSYMHDSDYSNVDRVGHRRWILNPPMGRTTFGYCNDSNAYYTWGYSGLYAFDESGPGRQAPVAWPAQNTPAEYMEYFTAWSVSYGKYNLKEDQIHVTLVLENTGRVWEFSSETNDAEYKNFFVNNVRYGQPGCVIFRPYVFPEYTPGMKFHVMIRNDEDHTVTEYRVTFF